MIIQLEWTEGKNVGKVSVEYDTSLLGVMWSAPLLILEMFKNTLNQDKKGELYL